MNIGIIGPIPPPLGGVTLDTLNLCKYMKKIGENVQLFRYTYREGKFFRKRRSRNWNNFTIHYGESIKEILMNTRGNLLGSIAINNLRAIFARIKLYL